MLKLGEIGGNCDPGLLFSAAALCLILYNSASSFCFLFFKELSICESINLGTILLTVVLVGRIAKKSKKHASKVNLRTAVELGDFAKPTNSNVEEPLQQ